MNRCEDCQTDLLPVRDEVYCPGCDLACDFEEDKYIICVSCKTMKLALWYPFDKCPSCIHHEDD